MHPFPNRASASSGCETSVLYRFLTSEREGGVERLTLNRPEVRNAFDHAMVNELASWAARVASDRSVRAVVVAGAGPVFCAGGDLAWMAKTVEFTEAQNVSAALTASRMFSAIDTLPCPVIARVFAIQARSPPAQKTGPAPATT